MASGKKTTLKPVCERRAMWMAALAVLWLCGCPGGGDGLPVPVPKTLPSNRLVLDAELVELTPTPAPRDILPYRKALVVHAWDVRRVIHGDCPPGRIAVAHWAIVDGKPVGRVWRVGQTVRLEIEPMADHPELREQRQIMDIQEMDLPMYYEPAD